MFKINCLVFWEVFDAETESNEFRDSLITFCKSEDKLVKKISAYPMPEKIRDLKNKLPKHKNEVCHFLLVFYTYITEPQFLDVYSSEQVNQS